MEGILLRLSDYFFVALHSLLILFNLFGWVRRRWLPYNLATLLLTGGSWVLLGFFWGWGYCPLTEGHWWVLNRMGRLPQTGSYVAYLLMRVLGLHLTNSQADSLTLWVYLAALSVSSCLPHFFGTP